MGSLSRRKFAKLAATGVLGAIGAAGIAAMGGGLSGCANTTSGRAASSLSSATASSSPSSVTSSNASAQGSQVVVTMPTTSEPAAGFDPLVAWGCGEHMHEPLIQSTLLRTNTNLEFENDLATSYECSDDGLTWTFAIRGDVVFSDGTPLTAADVAFTLNGIRTSDRSECDLSMVADVEAPDDTTVIIHMERPYNILLYLLCVIGIVPAETYSEGYGSAPIGSGRYVLEQWDRGQQAILVANPLYYGAAPNISRVVVLFAEEDTSLALAQAGETDVAYASAVLADNLPQGYALLRCQTVDSRGISLPCIPSGTMREDGTENYPAGNDVTCDVVIRQAINYAVDRDVLIDNVLNGYGIAAYSVCDGQLWSLDAMRCETDVDRAISILEDAGWVVGPDGIREKDGVRASFTLLYTAGDSVRQAIANEFANQMRTVGIEVNVQSGSWDELYPREYADPIVWGWGTNSPVETYSLFYSTSAGNYASYSTAETDENIDLALSCTRVEDSYQYWQAAQQGLTPDAQAPWVWLANVEHLYFVRDGVNVAEQKPHPHGHGWSIVNNVDQWSVA